MKRFATYAICSLFPLSCLAEGSPWLPEPETGNVNTSYVFQTSDEFYRAAEKKPTPGGGEDLSQHTLWLSVNYGLTDDFAIDFRTGYSKSEFITGPGIPTIDDSFTGIADSTIGFTWRFVDEDVSEKFTPSAAIRIAGIVAGDYDTGYINSIGDGGSGFETSLILGRMFGENFALSGEMGYRKRNNDIPDETFYNVTAYYVFSALTTSLEYKQVNALSGLDIGGPGFMPSKFPQLDEDYQLFGLGFSYSVTESLNVGLNLATVISGRNTNDSDALGITVGYSFDTY
jgi:hypothetical protein